jgi:signal transduction histidine kinase
MQLEILNLKDSAEFLKTLIDNIPSAIFIVDKDTVVRNFNDSFRALFNSPVPEQLNKRCGNAIGCYYAVSENKECGDASYCGQCSLRKAFTSAFTQKVPVYREKMTREFYINNVITLKHLRYTTKYMEYAGEQMVLVIVDDITEIETHKIRLEELNAQKNKLLGMAAHDLRNPISVIGMYAEFITAELGENLNEKQVELLKVISEMSHFMLNLISDILDLAKIEAGKLDLEIKEENYRDFLERAVKLNSVIANQKKINILLAYKAGSDIVKFDRNKLEQVLNNLIGNAVKYSHPETIITVAVGSGPDGGVITEVIDQGQGIPAEELESIFKEFNKSSTRSTAGEKSTGLGLAISKKIIEGHGGQIGVTSEIKKGANFYFELPL